VRGRRQIANATTLAAMAKGSDLISKATPIFAIGKRSPEGDALNRHAVH
jgi:hypothetical protein